MTQFPAEATTYCANCDEDIPDNDAVPAPEVHGGVRRYNCPNCHDQLFVVEEDTA